MNEDAVIVEQANFRRLLQQSLERFNEAASRDDVRVAGRQLVILHSDCDGLMDDAFDVEWEAIGGEATLAATMAGNLLPWGVLMAAKTAFVRLLDRQGMGFQSEAVSPAAKMEADLLEQLHELCNADEAEVDVLWLDESGDEIPPLEAA